MKKIIFFFLFATLTITAQAQTKFGYLSYSKAIENMPEYATMQQNLASLRTQYDNETKRAEEEFNQKYELFLEGQKDFAPIILSKRQSELQELMDKNISFKKEAERLLKQAEADMYTPMKQKLNEILQKIGIERGYDFILNTDNDAVPFINSANGEDINVIVQDALKAQ